MPKKALDLAVVRAALKTAEKELRESDEENLKLTQEVMELEQKATYINDRLEGEKSAFEALVAEKALSRKDADAKIREAEARAKADKSEAKETYEKQLVKLNECRTTLRQQKAKVETLSALVEAAEQRKNSR